MANSSSKKTKEIKNLNRRIITKEIQLSSFTQLCPTLCDPMNHSMPGLPVHHKLLESTQTHVHWMVMPSNHLILCHPLLLCPQSFPASGAFQMSSSLHQVAKVLEFQPQHQPFQ